MTIIKDAIQDVADLLEERENWCQGNFSLDEHGKIVPVDSTSANCWCILGAVMRTAIKRNMTKDQTNAVRLQLQAGVHAATGTSQLSITKFNDTYGHEQVVAMLQATAERVK